MFTINLMYKGMILLPVNAIGLINRYCKCAYYWLLDETVKIKAIITHTKHNHLSFWWREQNLSLNVSSGCSGSSGASLSWLHTSVGNSSPSLPCRSFFQDLLSFLKCTWWHFTLLSGMVEFKGHFFCLCLFVLIIFIFIFLL